MDKIITPNQNSWEKIVQYYILIIALVATWYLRQVVFIFLLAFIVASILDKPVDILEKKCPNRWWATSLVYSILLMVGGAIIYLSFPVLTSYWNNIIQSIPKNIQQFLYLIPQQNSSSFPLLFNQLENLFQGSAYTLGGLVQQLIDIIGRVLTNFSFGGLVLLFAFFINGEKDSQNKVIRFILPSSYREHGVRLWAITRSKVSDWLFAQGILSVFVGVAAYIGFSLIHLPEAGLLAVAAAVLDFIPYVGPFMAAILAFTSGVSESIGLALLAIIIFFFIQFLENIVSPFLRGKVMKMSPLLVLTSLLIGGKLAGLGGMIIALPLAAAIKEFIQSKRYINN